MNMIRKALLLLTISLVVLNSVFAQTKQLKGIVKDETGEPLVGVSVGIKNTSIGTQTNVDGNFTLNVTEGAILTFRYVGYKPQEVTLKGQTTINVILQSNALELQEVVAIGYGTTTRESLTGSVSSVTAKQLQDMPVSTAAEALAGRLAGVQVTTTEGAPGADILIRVRGGGSISGDNTPLFVVDGIVVENALSILSPQEIQSIDVLKDAASTSIYGARGANGVVIITTKGGKEMPTQITYNGFGGVRNITNKIEVMNPYDFVQYQYQIYNYNTNEQTRNSFIDRYGRYEDLDIYKSMPFVNWQDEVFGRDAYSQTHVLGVSGGTKATTYNFTLNRADEDGIMLNSGYKRTLASFRFDHKVNKKLKVGLNFRYSDQDVTGVGTSNTGTQSNNRLRNAVRFRPFIGPGLESEVDEFDPEYTNLTNLASPVLLANNEIREDGRINTNLNGYFNLELVKNLTFRSVLGYVTNDRVQNFFYAPPSGVTRTNNANNQPVVDIRKSNDYSVTNSNTLNYSKKFGKHQTEFLLGQETYIWKGFTDNKTIRWLPIGITPEQAFASIQRAVPPADQFQSPPSTGVSENRILSFFGRVNYNYQGKYLATASLRYDGSSKFNRDNGFAAFPAVTLGWRISEEKFMSNIKGDWLNNMKVRFSLGSAGNNRIGDDLFKTVYGSSASDGYAFGTSITPSSYPLSLANSNLRWEKTTSRNLGLDLDLFGSRLTANVDFYLNTVNDLLFDVDIPKEAGNPTQVQNVGATQNKGFEIQLAGAVIANKKFTWNANFNIGVNRNKVVSLGLDASGNPLASRLIGSGWASASNQYQDFLLQVGQPIGQFYGYVTDGYYKIEDFDITQNTNGSFSYVLKDGIPNSFNLIGNRAPQPGDLKLKKLSPVDPNSANPYRVDANDRTVLGNAQPKFTGGLNQQFAYKNFDMSVFLNWSVGGKVYNANNLEFTSQYLYRDNNMLAVMNNRWKWYNESGVLVTEPTALAALNENTTFWTPSSGAYFLHSYAIEDASFLRISNLTLGYTMPQDLIRKSKFISNLRVYATVNNLWTITGYSGFDPEANTRRASPLTPSVDYAAYPRSRYVLAGINMTF